MSEIQRDPNQEQIQLKVESIQDPNSIQAAWRRFRRKIGKVFMGSALAVGMTYGGAELGENYVADKAIDYLKISQIAQTKPKDTRNQNDENRSWVKEAWDNMKDKVANTTDGVTASTINTLLEHLRGPAREISWWIGGLTGLVTSLFGMYGLGKLKNGSNIVHTDVNEILITGQKRQNEIAGVINDQAKKIRELETIIQELQAQQGSVTLTDEGLKTRIRQVLKEINASETID